METSVWHSSQKFELDVPFKVKRTGEKSGAETLFIYLHGYKQNMQISEKQFNKITALRGYHAFIQAPYLVFDEARKRPLQEWGRAWYLYDGTQEVFLNSLEKSSVFLQHTLDDILEKVDVQKICLIGYSMGGYLSGYFAFSRPRMITHLVVIGARLKTEAFSDQDLQKAKNVRIIALHGNQDKSVKTEPQQREIEKLRSLNLNAEFVKVNGGHQLSSQIVDNLYKWLITNGF